MITIKHNNDCIRITGHSNADVCAAISSITYTGVNFLIEYKENCIDFTDNVDPDTNDGEMVIRVLTHDETIDKILNTMINMYSDVVEQVPPSCVELKDML